MSQKIIAQTIDGMTQASLQVAPFSINMGGIDRGEVTFTDVGEKKARNGDFTSAVDRNLRSMGWAQQIDESTLDNLNSSYSDLKDIICQPRWVLVLNAGGANEKDRYYDCYAVTTVP